VREVLLDNTKTGETSTLRTDGVFVAIGYAPAVELARKIGVELTAEGYIKKDSRHRTNIPESIPQGCRGRIQADRHCDR